MVVTNSDVAGLVGQLRRNDIAAQRFGMEDALARVMSDPTWGGGGAAREAGIATYRNAIASLGSGRSAEGELLSEVKPMVITRPMNLDFDLLPGQAGYAMTGVGQDRDGRPIVYDESRGRAYLIDSGSNKIVSSYAQGLDTDSVSLRAPNNDGDDEYDQEDDNYEAMYDD